METPPQATAADVGKLLAAHCGTDDPLWTRLAVYVVHWYAVATDRPIFNAPFTVAPDGLPEACEPQQEPARLTETQLEAIQTVAKELIGVPTTILERAIRAELAALQNPAVLRPDVLRWFYRCRDTEKTIRPPFRAPEEEAMFARLLEFVIERAETAGLQPAVPAKGGDWDRYIVEVVGDYNYPIDAVVHNRHWRVPDDLYEMPRFRGWVISSWSSGYQHTCPAGTIRVLDENNPNDTRVVSALRIPPAELLAAWAHLSDDELEKVLEAYNVLADELEPEVAMNAATLL